MTGNWRRDSLSVDCATTSTGSRRCISRMRPSFCSKNWPRWISPLACLPIVLACQCGKEDKGTSWVDRDQGASVQSSSFFFFPTTWPKHIFAFVPVTLINYEFSYSTPPLFFVILTEREQIDFLLFSLLAFLWRTKDARWTVTYLDLIRLWFTCDRSGRWAWRGSECLGSFSLYVLSEN